MAIKKGRATDAVARLFSVTAAEQPHEAYEAHEVKREHPVPETHEAHESYEALHVPDTQEAYEVHEVRREHPVSETHEAQEAYKVPHMPGTHEAHEAHAPKADGAYRAADTQGKRGKKALRMTMAFSEENMDYIRTMGKLESGGATAYVNRLIEADRRKHADVYRQMKTLRPDA